MHLFFDTETTGLPLDWKAPVTRVNNWPRLVQFAWLFADDQGNEIESAEFIIKPDGFTIPPDATSKHGITTAKAIKDGVPLSGVLDLFDVLLDRAQQLIAHNISFDECVVGAEFLRAKRENKLARKTRFCTKEESTEYCKLPGRYGYKWPTLEELHATLFGTAHEKAHSALADTRATSRCYFELRRLGAI